MLDRRQALKAALGGVGTFALTRSAFGRQSGVTRLTDSLSLLTDVGTNVLVLSQPDGLVLVDSGSAAFTSVLMGHLAALDPQGRARVDTVFNTHYHTDHTGCNEALTPLGASIVAHENTRLWMATDYWVPAEERYENARGPGAHPTETFYTDGAMTAGEERIDYGYLIEAHTSGDIYVFFRDSNVLAAGDVASPARDPELDYFTGAWIGGRLDAMDRLLDLTDEQTRIVPGHGPVMSRSELQVERDMLSTIYDRMVELVRNGDSAQNMLDAGVMAGLTRVWDDPFKFLYDAHKGLWAHHNKLAPNVV